MVFALDSNSIEATQNTHTMTSADGVVFVLWGSQFDEAPATIFITEFRNAGLRVKVVGLHGQHTIFLKEI